MGNKVQRIYVGSNLVRPTWKPGPDTVLYVPFKSDLLDHSGNNISFTNSGVTVANGVGVFNQNYMYTTNITVPNNTKFTVNCWARRTANPSSAKYTIIQQQTDQDYNYRGWKMSFLKSSDSYKIAFEGGTIVSSATPINSVLNVRYNVSYIRNGINEIKTYVNGEWYETRTLTSDKTFLPNWLSIGGEKWYNSSGGDKLTGNVSEVILEDKVWDASEVRAYYNQTKANYGL